MKMLTLVLIVAAAAFAAGRKNEARETSRERIHERLRTLGEGRA